MTITPTGHLKGWLEKHSLPTEPFEVVDSTFQEHLARVKAQHYHWPEDKQHDYAAYVVRTELNTPAKVRQGPAPASTNLVTQVHHHTTKHDEVVRAIQAAEQSAKDIGAAILACLGEKGSEAPPPPCVADFSPLIESQDRVAQAVREMVSRPAPPVEVDLTKLQAAMTAAEKGLTSSLAVGVEKVLDKLTFEQQMEDERAAMYRRTTWTQTVVSGLLMLGIIVELLLKH